MLQSIQALIRILNKLLDLLEQYEHEQLKKKHDEIDRDPAGFANDHFMHNNEVRSSEADDSDRNQS